MYIVLAIVFCTAGADVEWRSLIEPPFEKTFRKPHGDWFHTSAVAVDPKDPKKLAATPGEGPIVVNGKGRTNNLVTLEKFGPIELHCEFLIPKGSNAGIKFESVYEIQILDSYGKKKISGSDCGGVYPRSESKPRYHHIDEGIAPKVNACKPPGEWQTLDVVFVPPQVDAEGKRTAKARIERALLNGQVIHDKLELEWPTGNAWKNKPVPTGPILLQADHGPIAFRSLKVRPWRPDGSRAGS